MKRTKRTRREDVKRNRLVHLLLLLLLMSCGGDATRKIRLEIPAYSTFQAEEFQGVVLTDFLIVNTPEGFDLNREIAAFFVPEFERKLGLAVAVPHVLPESEVSIRRPDFWQALAPGSPRRLYITGKAERSLERILFPPRGKSPSERSSRYPSISSSSGEITGRSCWTGTSRRPKPMPNPTNGLILLFTTWP
jgi:hypothetical protein